jgi:hypothetical protein
VIETYNKERFKMNAQIVIEISRRAVQKVTREYVLRELATGAAVGALLDGATAFFSGKNPAKEGAKGAIAGAAGNGAALVLRDIARRNSPFVMAGSMMASIGTRYVINVITGKTVVENAPKGEEVLEEVGK